MNLASLYSQILGLVRGRKRLAGREIAQALGQSPEAVFEILVSLEAGGEVRVHSQGDGLVWWEMA